jgi:RHS repeat-associated protein
MTNHYMYLGSARVTLSTTAEPLQSSSYHPYGTERTSTGSSARTSYIGREHDNETDLGFYGVRLYEPEYGRFLSVDPLWSKYLPYSAYQYCRNNPLNLIDDSGLGDEPIRERPVATTAEGKAAAMILSATPVARDVDGNPTGPPDAYNCHSLAWSDGAGDPTDPENEDLVAVLPKWDNDPQNNATDGWAQLSFDEPNQVGDRVIYFNEAVNSEGKLQGYVAPTHSAVVVGVDECGNANLVISKWGGGPGFLHHPRDVPASYSEQESTAVTSENDTYSTRVYYRKQEPK